MYFSLHGATRLTTIALFSLTASIWADDRSGRDVVVGLNNLRQIMLAMHNYHSDYGYLCSYAITNPKAPEKDRKPLLSWRVAILPYLEQDSLYKQFRLDEPWDSEHNQTLITKMPKIYQMPGKPANVDGKTHYQVFVNHKDYKGKYIPIFKFDLKEKQTLGRISVADGTSNTIAVAEAHTPVIWTKPEDMVIDSTIEDDTTPFKLMGVDSEWKVCLVGFVDGSVRSLKMNAVDAKQWKQLVRAMIGYRDGEVVDLNKIIK